MGGFALSHLRSHHERLKKITKSSEIINAHSKKTRVSCTDICYVGGYTYVDIYLVYPDADGSLMAIDILHMPLAGKPVMTHLEQAAFCVCQEADATAQHQPQAVRVLQPQPILREGQGTPASETMQGNISQSPRFGCVCKNACSTQTLHRHAAQRKKKTLLIF